MIPAQYKWLEKEAGPKILVQALRLYGTLEGSGAANNPLILAWADEIGQDVGMKYTQDETPWCGLFMGVVAKRAGYQPPKICVRASSWDTWGNPVALKDMSLGDAVRLERPGGGHIALCVGHDVQGKVHLLGGNQSNAVNIMRFDMSRIAAVRRCPFPNFQPKNVRPVLLAASGQVSHNEA